jgi:hypothetical protein
MSEAPTLSKALYGLADRVQQHFTKADLAQQQNSLTLPLPSAAPGLYLLRIEDATGQTSARCFVRQRAARAMLLLNKSYS